MNACTWKLYEPARALVLREGRASISLVQRHLRIGYHHAMLLLDAMEGDVLTPKAADGTHALLPAPVHPFYIRPGTNERCL